MKLFVSVALVVISIFVHESTALKVCPKVAAGKEPSAPSAGTWYQVIQTNKHDNSTCYFLTITGSGKKVKISQSSMFDGFTINNTYAAVPNTNGTWDITKNGAESSEVFIDILSKELITIYTCTERGVLALEPGVYSQSKKLSSDEIKQVMEALKKNGVTENLVKQVERSKCV